jgi:RecA/RadA recombinase
MAIPDYGILKFLFFPTSNKELNRALGGGIERGVITAFFGRTSTLKISTCLDIALNACFKGYKVLYIDADAAGGLNSRRVLNALIARGEKIPIPEKYFASIKGDEKKIAAFEQFAIDKAESCGLNIVKAGSFGQLKSECLKAFMQKWDLIVADSLTLFFKDLTTIKKGFSSEEIRIIVEVIRKASSCVKETRCALIVVLQRKSDIGKEERLEQPDRDRETVGGESLSHHTNALLEFIIDPKSETHFVNIYKNRAGPGGKIPIRGTNEGIA